MTERNHALENARAWLADIREGMAALRQLESDDAPESVTYDGETFEDADALRERLQESPLSVLVRDGWRTPGAERPRYADEFEILLSTGGPALRIRGELSHGDTPETAHLEWQDWGTPWTVCRLDLDERADLLAFAGLFYFAD